MEDSFFYAQKGFYRGSHYRLPPMFDHVVTGMGAIAGASLFTFFNATRMYRWTERHLPMVQHPYARWLCVAPPLSLGVALSAGLGQGILPALAEVAIKLYYASSESISGFMRDIDTKK
jgi:hypothetical protein